MTVLSEQGLEQARAIVARYPHPRSALLPLLYLVQSEEGYVSREGMRQCAELLGLTTAEVEAVATFYTMFKKQPTGTWLVSVCTNLSCALNGANAVYRRAVEHLGEEAKGVTSDGLFTVEEVECLAACDAAPVVQVNYAQYDRVTPERVVELVDGLRAGHVPPPDHGPVPLDHRGTARLLAGLGDDRG